jgi:uroporphyrinogen III methyltransferase/synthase
MTMAQKVYLVGAGPGDPGLITVKGAEALQHADAVVYDFLANEKLLRLAKADCETIYVGKQAGKHSMPQEKINALLVRLWKEGKTVVRLKGGDPFVFGRGGEEAQALVEAKVPFEVVPGITAGLAGLAYAGIPATHRGKSVSATLVTGHEDPTKEASDLDWKALAASGGTIIVYMGVRNLPMIAKSLIDGGLGADTPAALVRMATFPEQEVVASTLGRIEAEAKAAGIKPPALFCVGSVVELRQELNWFENLPLFGKRIVITRPREQSTQQRAALEGLGASVIEHAAIEILPPTSFAELDQAIEGIHGFDIVLFTSVNGVKHFFERLQSLGFDSRKLAGTFIGVIGPATGGALEAFGIQPDMKPDRFTTAALIPALQDRFKDLKGKQALLPRADIAPDLLCKELEELGVVVKEVTAYRTLAAGEDKQALIEAFEQGRIDAVTFASSSAAQSFIDSLGADALKAHKGNARFVSIGPVTSQTLRDAGFPPDAEAKEHTIPGLTEALMKIFGQ